MDIVAATAPVKATVTVVGTAIVTATVMDTQIYRDKLLKRPIPKDMDIAQ